MALLDQFLASLMGAQTPWAQQKLAEMTNSGPVMPVSQGAANAGAPSAGLPATDSQVSRMSLGGPMPGPQAMPVPASPSAPTSFGTYLTGALKGASQANNPIGMLLGGLGGAIGAGDQVDQKRQSYELLIQSGFDPSEAALAIQNPALAQQVAARREKMLALSKEDADTNKNIEYLVRTGKLTKEQAEMLRVASPEMRKNVIASAFSTKAPDIQTIMGPYGQETAVTWDAQSNSWKPVQVGSGSPVAAPAGVPAPMAPAPQMPAPGPAMADPGATAPPSVVPAPGMGAPQPAQSPPQPQLPPGFRVGPSVPKPPEGYVHKSAPDGSGFLYRPDGQPVFESKAEAEAIAKARGESGAAREEEKRVARQFLGGVNRFKQLALDFGDQALERSIGPYMGGVADPETAGGLWGTGFSVDSIGRMAGRGISELHAIEDGGAPPTEIRDRIETTAKNLAAVMKPLVRKPGEGVWTDKDQINLEKSLGDLTRARSKEEYDRRLGDIVENVKNVFMIAVPDDPGPQTRSPNAPPRAEDVNTIYEDGLIGRLFGGSAPAPAKAPDQKQLTPEQIMQLNELLRRR